MSDYDLEELLDLLDRDDLKKVVSDTPKKRLPKNKHVLDFIDDYEVQSGEILVPNYFIYYVYKVEWKGRHMRNKLNKRAFFQTFGARFEQKRKTKFRGYLLNDCFGVTEEKLKIAFDYDRKLEKLRDTRRKTKKEKQKEERVSEKCLP